MRLQTLFLIVSILFVTLFGKAVNAEVVTSIPSCYAFFKMQPPSKTPDTELIVLIDQTVILDESLKRSLYDNALRQIAPGSTFIVLKFSAFSQGRYMDVLTQGTLEPLLPQGARDLIGVRTLAKLDTCLQRQDAYGRKLVGDAIKNATDGSSATLARSDIMGALRETSRIAATSNAKRKIVLVVSDMLENSAVSSFYAHNNVRNVDPQRELRKAIDAGMIGNFGGANVYVLGAGLMGDSGTAFSATAGSSSYRSPIAMEALHKFWEAYFSKSNAKLIEFGAPALLSPVQ
jgi:hypothetical protein